jgi:hypothetical protein
VVFELVRLEVPRLDVTMCFARSSLSFVTFTSWISLKYSFLSRTVVGVNLARSLPRPGRETSPGFFAQLNLGRATFDNTHSRFSGHAQPLRSVHANRTSGATR